MLNISMSFNSYLMLNGAIAFGYIVARVILGLAFFKRKMTQLQRLNFARYTFFVAALSFFIMPIIARFMPLVQHSDFILGPILKNRSIPLLQNHGFVSQPLSQIVSTPIASPIDFGLIIFLLIGCMFFLVGYIKNIMILQKLKRQSFCQHKINNVHILVSQIACIPFCWSFIKNHFIIIPQALLEKNNDLRLSVRHELQHIRQGDTYWLHFFILIKACCFWNPIIKLWITWLDELQEFSCDESMVLNKKTLPVDYAECLVNAVSDKFELVPQIALGIHGLSKSVLYRRINMLFNYNHSEVKKISILLAYVLSFFMAISAAYACNCSSSIAPLTIKQVITVISKSHLDSDFQISATPEVVNEINNIRNSEQARSFMHDALQRMKKYQPLIQTVLKKEGMPDELLAVPLVESGYQPLDQSKNPVHAAGVWQFVPETARHFGLIVNDKHDDRFDINLSTQAAIAYLQKLHEQFHDWKLAVLAYEYGEQYIEKLIKDVGSRDAWVLARSPITPKTINMEKFISMFDAAVIIMRNPSLISE